MVASEGFLCGRETVYGTGFMIGDWMTGTFSPSFSVRGNACLALCCEGRIEGAEA